MQLNFSNGLGALCLTERWSYNFPFVPRQRPVLGECLATLAAAMPVAFLEPSINVHNVHSVFNTKSPRERISKSHGLSLGVGSRSYKHYVESIYQIVCVDLVRMWLIEL